MTTPEPNDQKPTKRICMVCDESFWLADASSAMLFCPACKAALKEFTTVRRRKK